MEAFDIEFHNVDHLEREGFTGSWKLCRFPKEGPYPDGRQSSKWMGPLKVSV